MKRINALIISMLALFGVLLCSCERDDNDSNNNNDADVTYYTLKVLPNSAAWGVATGSGTYAANTRVDIEAIPATGYSFRNWSDSVETNPRTITITSDSTIYAVFGISLNFNWVDLGLPSGLLWAIRNVGATTPEDYGDYFAWGEFVVKHEYSWSTYWHSYEGTDKLTKYCSRASWGYNGFVDTLTTLEHVDDAAYFFLGAGARIPTIDEWEELRNYCSLEWVSQNDVLGYLVTSRTNGNKIFLPAAGYYDGETLRRLQQYGYYWSSTASTAWHAEAERFNFGYTGSNTSSDYRYYGFSVRAVWDKNLIK